MGATKGIPWRVTVIGGVFLAVMAASALASDWRQILADPAKHVGKRIDFAPAFCGGGGPAGADPGLYQCSVGKGGLYVQSRTVPATRAAQKMKIECGGLDVVEQSPSCRFKVTLTPRSYHMDGTLGTDKSVLLIEADSLELN